MKLHLKHIVPDKSILPSVATFDVRKAENYLEKTENDRNFTVRKQKVRF